MPLAGLPTELLDEIILHTLPEGFESLALTCKKFHALCTPFIDNHNKLRLRFHDFRYYYTRNKPQGAVPIKTAWDLIIHIASEPIVARYIRNIDCGRDGMDFRERPRNHLAYIRDPQRSEAVARLLRNSPHLKEASLSWESFRAEIEERVGLEEYSQSAAAFLLTLLPNVKTLRLPRSWETNVATHKLLYAIIVKATQSHQPWDGRSLAQVTKIHTNFSCGSPGRGEKLNDLIPFVSLPRLQSFSNSACKARGDALLMIESKDLYRGYKQALETLNLESCCIEDAALAHFLKHTPCLKTLVYSHQDEAGTHLPEWDICKFITAIERELVPSWQNINARLSAIAKLEIPLEVVMWDIRFASSIDPTTEHTQLFIGDIVPASVSQLALISKGQAPHQKVLDILFRNFAAKKSLQLSVLQEIHLSYPLTVEDAYKEQCAKLASELQQTEVVLKLERAHFFHWERR